MKLAAGRGIAMIVSGKYELLEIVQESEVRTYRARHVAMGHDLLVHFIPGTDNADDFALLEQLAQLPDSERQLFFDAGEQDSLPYLVSWPLPEFDSLPNWLERTLRKYRLKLKPPAAVPKTGRTDPGEFSRLFFSGLKEPPPAAVQPPGEFTRLFQVPSEEPKAPPSPEVQSKPGEFARLFQGPSSPRPQSPPSSVEPGRAVPGKSMSRDSGEFAKYFQGQVGSAPPVESPRIDPKPPVASSVPGSDPLPATPRFPPPQVRTGEPSDPLRLVAMPAAAPKTPAIGGADDYDRVVGPAPPVRMPSPLPGLPQAPALPLPLPPYAALPRAGKSDYLHMWIGLGVLFLLAVAMVLFFALSR